MKPELNRNQKRLLNYLLKTKQTYHYGRRTIRNLKRLQDFGFLFVNTSGRTAEIKLSEIFFN